MPRKNSLTHADFIRAEKARLGRERGSFFILSFGVLPGLKTSETKAGCVVSKKTAARAVDRNLIKRRWRDAMRQCLPAVPAPSTGESVDFVAWPAHLNLMRPSTGAHPHPMCPPVLVFYAMKPAKDASYADIKNDVAQLVARASAKFRAS